MKTAFTDDELRGNHEFVLAFETLRKRHGQREMHDDALRRIADVTGTPYETLRVARHLRNALAHGETVNRDALERHLQLLRDLDPREEPGDHATDEDASGAYPVRAYRVHAWKDPQLEQEMVAHGFVSVGGEEIGDLTGVEDPETIRTELTRSMPEYTPRAIALFVGYWRRFLWDAEPGDLVVLPTRDRSVSIGEFVGPYLYVPNVEPRARHRRPVSWTRVGVERDDFGDDLVKVLSGRHTVQEFKQPEAIQRLQAIARTGRDPSAP